MMAIDSSIRTRALHLNLSPKPFAPAAERNKAAILDVLRTELRAGDSVLELGSGTGQHLAHFAAALPAVSWQPSDLGARLPGMHQWIEESGCRNLRAPIELDIGATDWIDAEFDVCYTANTLHIIAWPLVVRLFSGCADILKADGKLCVYGPFAFDGEHISENNRRFDESLRAGDADSGIRDRSALDDLALEHGFAPARVIPLPTSNHLLVYQAISRRAPVTARASPSPRGRLPRSAAAPNRRLPRFRHDRRCP